MRKIEFKAVKDDMSNVIFVFGQLVYDAVGQPRITELDSSGKGLTFHTCLKNTECQFTGILDKNEKRIFEKDILKTEDGICQVVFQDGGFAYLIRKNETFCPAYNWHIEEIEIIGNSFQNPELLEGVC